VHAHITSFAISQNNAKHKKGNCEKPPIFKLSTANDQYYIKIQKKISYHRGQQRMRGRGFFTMAVLKRNPKTPKPQQLY